MHPPPPPGSWMAINNDACFRSSGTLAGCGGVMCDNAGNWRGGFSCTIKANNVAEAECWAILKAI